MHKHTWQNPLMHHQLLEKPLKNFCDPRPSICCPCTSGSWCGIMKHKALMKFYFIFTYQIGKNGKD